MAYTRRWYGRTMIKGRHGRRDHGAPWPWGALIPVAGFTTSVLRAWPEWNFGFDLVGEEGWPLKQSQDGC